MNYNDNMNALTRYRRAVKENEIIFNEQWLNENIMACQNALATQFVPNIEFMPQLNIQENFIAKLPETLQCVILHLSQETQFDHLTCSIIVLAAISTAMCGRFKIVLKDSWSEAVVLFSMLIAESGIGKDALLNMVKSPLAQVVEEMQTVYENNAPGLKGKVKAQSKALEQEFNANIKEIRKAARQATAGSIFDKIVDEVGKLNDQAYPTRMRLESVKPGVLPNLFLSNTTEKGLIHGLADQGGHQAVMEPEPGFIQKIVELGSRFNIDLMLKAYDQSDNIDITASKTTNLIRPALNLLYCVQPVVASRFFNGNSNERGLAPRFMPIFSYKLKVNGQYDYRSQFQRFSDTVQFILRQFFTQEQRRELYPLNVTRIGQAHLEEFQWQNQSLIQSGNNHMASFLRKLHGKACRIAGILHVWDCFATTRQVTLTISDHAIEAGIAIARALIPHANHAFSPAGLPGVDPAQRIMEWFTATGKFFASRTDIRQHIFSGVKNQHFNGGLERLLQTHHLGKIFDHNGSPIYVVNPQISGWFNPPPMPPLELPSVVQPLIPGTAL